MRKSDAIPLSTRGLRLLIVMVIFKVRRNFIYRFVEFDVGMQEAMLMLRTQHPKFSYDTRLRIATLKELRGLLIL